MTPTESSESKDAVKRSLLSRFRQLTFWNKLATVGSIASLVSIPLAVYLYFAAIQTRDLMYRDSFEAWTVFDPARSSRLSMSYSGEPVNRKVVAKQIVIWNEGNQSIRSENVLSTISLVTDPPIEILDASVVDVTRDVVGFKIDTTELSKGRIPLSWNILEHKDGALVQIVCFQDSLPAWGRGIALEGTVEGQRQFRNPKGTSLADSFAMEVMSLVVSIFMLAGGCGLLFSAHIATVEKDGRRLRLGSMFCFAIGIGYGWIAFNVVFDWPPFSWK